LNLCFFTDTLSDKSFLESSFPSLRENVVPVDKYGNLDPFLLPADIQICVRSEALAINVAMSTIIEKVPLEESEPDLIVGFDCE